jgi:hypothetical protein
VRPVSKTCRFHEPTRNRLTTHARKGGSGSGSRENFLLWFWWDRVTRSVEKRQYSIVNNYQQAGRYDDKNSCLKASLYIIEFGIKLLHYPERSEFTNL